MTIKIHNIRYGFATNSSSTHSIIIMNGNDPITDCSNNQDFGWDLFTLVSEKVKREYIGQILKLQFSRLYKLDCNDSAILASYWAGVDIDPEGCVDHQSCFSFPHKEKYSGTKIDKEFFNEFLEFILRDDIAIIGGNDNDYEELPYSNNTSDIDTSIALFTRDYLRSNVRARKDKRGGFWALFDWDSGTKIRMSFDSNVTAKKSEAPELVDVKITGYCNRNCRYCYQGSTQSGKHADIPTIKHISYALGSLGVFEVAIGGGEPTEHPEFEKIISTFHSDGIKPSFSTRNINWILENFHKIKDKVGAVGFSIDTSKGLSKNLKKLAEIDGLNITVQVAVGSCDESELKKIIKICGEFDVTCLLLGWKSIGRGNDCEPINVNIGKVLDSFKDKSNESVLWNGPQISFDTVMIKQAKEWIDENVRNEFINPWFFTLEEGDHSMYIDCCTRKMACSSFVDIEEMVDLPQNKYGKPLLCDVIKDYFSAL
jgi:sulfatase maturation enzyme AslB (radical SAM superfamily)